MSYGSIYFWTVTILHWNPLLLPDTYKDVITGSLQNLSDRKLVDVFGFVVMPNHVHLIWRPLKPNGNETPQGSFLKFTAHQFKQRLVDDHGPEALRPYEVAQKDRQYSFWQRDPMAIILYSRDVARQKLDYTHRNPTTERWALAVMAEEYVYSSARYYTCGDDRFPFLQSLWDELWR